MELTNGVQATFRLQTTAPKTDPSDTDVRAVLIAAFPTMWGQGKIEVEHIDGQDWLVTVPTDAWKTIESEGYFEFGAPLADGAWGKIEIEYPY